MLRFAPLALILLLGADDPLAGDKFVEKADAKYEQAAERIRADAAKQLAKEAETRLATYRTLLSAATKSGNFERAAAIKARIDELEAEAADLGLPSKHKPKIPKDAVKFGGHHYSLIRDRLTWHIAKARCEGLGGHLACIETPAESAMIFELCGSTPAWVGATDEVTEGEWRWVNDTPAGNLDARIENGAEVEHYLAYNPAAKRLDDWDGGARCAFVCEWDE